MAKTLVYVQHDRHNTRMTISVSGSTTVLEPTVLYHSK